MEKRQPKDLSNYKKRFENDPSSFNDFQAMDYVRELKNQNLNDEAIEVGSTFLEVGDNLTSFINHYAYALYNKFINIEIDKISEKESLFFSFVDDIIGLCKQEKYSPLESTINKAIKYLLSQDTIDYKKISQLLDHLDPMLANAQPFNANGKEFESKRERWFRLKVRCLYELKDYKDCVENANKAIAQTMKWHQNNLNWIKYYRASSLVFLNRFEEAENAFLSLGNRLPKGDSFEVLYNLYLNTQKTNDAYTLLVYKFFTSGLDSNLISLYEKVLEMIKTNENNQELNIIANAFVYKIKEENNKDISAMTIEDSMADKDSSSLYDRLYNALMDQLDSYIERIEGRVAYYNEEKEFGSIYQEDKDNLFFKQADYIYDEEVQKRDVVEYSIIKTFDVKKQQTTSRAILLKTLYEDINY